MSKKDQPTETKSKKKLDKSQKKLFKKDKNKLNKLEKEIKKKVKALAKLNKEIKKEEKDLNKLQKKKEAVLVAYKLLNIGQENGSENQIEDIEEEDNQTAAVSKKRTPTKKPIKPAATPEEDKEVKKQN